MFSARINLFSIFFLFVSPVFAQIPEYAHEDTIFTRALNNKLCENQSEEDSIIARQFQNDTLNFIFFPENNLLDSIIPNRQISYWELNFEGHGYYRNLYNPKSGESKSANDTVVLSKSKEGFGTVCAPGYCVWYISAKLLSEKIVTLTDWKAIKFFIGYLDNPFDAYFWLTMFTNFESRNLPVKVTDFAQYKILKDGYLIKVKVRVKDCIVTYADILYFVGKNKKVTFIQVIKTFETGGCI